MRAGRGAHPTSKNGVTSKSGYGLVRGGRGTRIGIGVLGGCGVATAVVVALIGVLGAESGTTPRASSTGPQPDGQIQNAQGEGALATPKAPDSSTSKDSSSSKEEETSWRKGLLWSGAYELRVNLHLDLDDASGLRTGKGAADDLWLDNFGDSGHLLYTEGALAPWDLTEKPSAAQCRRLVAAGATTRLRVTAEDEGTGLCLQTTDEDRFAYIGFTTIDRAGIQGEAMVWKAPADRTF